MEGFLILLVIIILIVIVVFPIIIYSKVSSIRNDIEYLNNSFNDLNSKLTRFFKETGSQEAVKERQEAANELSAMENVKPTNTEVKEPEVVEEVPLPDIHIAAFQEKVFEDHPVEERTRVVDEPKEETIPSFAASISHENEEAVVSSISAGTNANGALVVSQPSGDDAAPKKKEAGDVLRPPWFVVQISTRHCGCSKQLWLY